MELWFKCMVKSTVYDGIRIPVSQGNICSLKIGDYSTILICAPQQDNDIFMTVTLPSIIYSIAQTIE